MDYEYVTEDEVNFYTYYCFNCKKTYDINKLKENNKGISVCVCGSANHTERD